MSERIATYILAIFFATGGILALSVAITGADWFFSSSGVKGLTGRLDKKAVRIIYAVVGLAILAVTLLLLHRGLNLP